ncbi:hypothetical protein K491DRAFT_720259 [Lophiostoma macrostomum CBS 122681]|uniref:Uncharacterized protein n=1 Tax=Lophiostoma macrostomum CBS 122681 TaxID=1314788 RepID=A0A6A6STV1_9PLEO|nr:hypothetical protein K491DRAFT_720259 [Lophiostoma macrostomum CBS 122681]
MTRTSPSSSPRTRGLPYKSHPLYRLRLATLINAFVGFLLNFLAIASLAYDDSYAIPPFIFSQFLHFVSFLVVLHDLITYAIAKVSNSAARQTQSAQPSGSNSQPVAPTAGRDHASAQASSTPVPSHGSRPAGPSSTSNEDVDWPSKRLIIADLVLAIVFQWLFWALFFYILNAYHRYFTNGAEMFEAYANLSNIVAGLLHAVAAWKEIMARKKQNWRREYERDMTSRTCGNYGVSVGDLDADVDARDEPEAPDLLGDEQETTAEAGPSFLERFGKGKVVLPRCARGPDYVDGDIEKQAADAKDDAIAPLLVTPDDSSSTEVAGPSGYGTLSQSVESLNRAAETMVKKKDKGKKRIVDVESV